MKICTWKTTLSILMIVITKVTAPIPGTFFWKPRLGLDLAIPTTEPSLIALKPTMENLREGLVVLIEGYQAGVTVISLAAGVSSAMTYRTLNPMSAYFYTNAYRWGLRYFSMIPYWLSGQSIHFVETHKVWTRRFFYVDEFMPKWMHNLVPYVDKSEWDKELQDFKRYKKYSEAAFGKHYRFPSKHFRDFRSELTVESDSQDHASHSESK